MTAAGSLIIFSTSGPDVASPVFASHPSLCVSYLCVCTRQQELRWCRCVCAAELSVWRSAGCSVSPLEEKFRWRLTSSADLEASWRVCERFLSLS